MVNTVASILKLGASINLYMFHGGTNFGFMNGALKTDEYKSDVTSYGEFSVTALLMHLLWECSSGCPLGYLELQKHFEIISATPWSRVAELERSSEANAYLRGGLLWCFLFADPFQAVSLGTVTQIIEYKLP